MIAWNEHLRNKDLMENSRCPAQSCWPQKIVAQFLSQSEFFLYWLKILVARRHRYSINSFSDNLCPDNSSTTNAPPLRKFHRGPIVLIFLLLETTFMIH